MNDYQRIKKAIEFIKDNFTQQPSLDEIAQQIHLSPFHFQRLFKEWAGVSPKKFLQYISIEHAKKLLKDNLSLLDTSFEVGLSGTSRLHDLFITIEGMTPGEYKNDGESLTILYDNATTPFGDVIIASTDKGICHLSFIESKMQGISELQKRFKKAHLVKKKNDLQSQVLQFFSRDFSNLSQLKLHLKGTAFQLKVWQSLLNIPEGQLSTYAAIAQNIQHDKAVRAVGTAIGNNPVAYLIPCHRVIQSTGLLGQYRYGSIRKTALIGYESAQVFGEGI